ncbi:MAG: hypothetical protein V2B19_03870 [Pseudomonadota bacterium]
MDMTIEPDSIQVSEERESDLSFSRGDGFRAENRIQDMVGRGVFFQQHGASRTIGQYVSVVRFRFANAPPSI